MRSLGGNLYDRICSMENLREAHCLAKRGKVNYKDVKMIERNSDKHLRAIRRSLLNQTFTTSKYEIKSCTRGGKERVIHKLPYYPDRIVQHAIVNQCSQFWISLMIKDTYQSITGRGAHQAISKIKKVIWNTDVRYAAKFDIKKFYPSVKNEHLLNPKVFRIRCDRTNWLLRDIITSLDQIPLGNHTSQYAGNLLLTPIDWYCKQTLKVKHYFRYCDDIVILSSDLAEVDNVYKELGIKLAEIDLELKPEYELINLNNEYLDFLGYQVSRLGTKVRPNIVKNFEKHCKKGDTRPMASYYGWFKHGGSLNKFHCETRGMAWR